MTEPIIFREEYLDYAGRVIGQVLEAECGLKPVPVRWSVGYGPGRRGPVAGSTGRTEHCIPPAMTEDGIPQVFISPEISNTGTVLTAVTHALLHVHHGNGHRGAYQTSFKKLKLIGTTTDPVVGRAYHSPLLSSFNHIATEAGEYSDVHGKVNANDRKKQGTALKLIECQSCGFWARTIQSNLDLIKAFPQVFQHECPPSMGGAGGGAGGAGAGQKKKPRKNKAKPDLDVTPPNAQGSAPAPSPGGSGQSTDGGEAGQQEQGQGGDGSASGAESSTEGDGDPKAEGASPPASSGQADSTGGTKAPSGAASNPVPAPAGSSASDESGQSAGSTGSSEQPGGNQAGTGGPPPKSFLYDYLKSAKKSSTKVRASDTCPHGLRGCPFCEPVRA